MATPKRQTDPVVDDPARLFASRRGQFHDVLRVLERELARADANATRLGLDGPSDREPIRLQATPNLAFPAAEVTDIQRLGGARTPRYRIRTNVLGLTGAGGALPRHYTNTVAERARRKEHALGDFLNLFDHRLLALLHRAWGKYKPAIQLEEVGDGKTPAYTRAVDALGGQLPGRGTEDRRYYAGHFARGNRSAAGLITLLGDYLGLPVDVQPLAGQWLTLEPSDRVRLGSGRRGANNHLGSGVLTGRRVWSVDSRIIVHIGPLTHAEHRTLMPGTAQYRGMQRLIADYTPVSLTVDLQFHLNDAAEGPAPLGGNIRLGRNAWLCAGRRPLRPAALRLGRDPQH